MLRFYGIILLLGFVLFACDTEPAGNEDIDLSNIEYNPVAYEIKKPFGFPEMEIPEDNPMTQAGFELGRFLFYDPILSADSTMSCSTCHEPVASFTDNLAVSPGITGEFGRRSSMSLLNVGYYQNGLFWDGRSNNLESQALLPVEDPIELHNEWPNLIEKLKKHQDYPARFRKAFGIQHTGLITKELAAKALAQFERALVSSGRSKYDRVKEDKASFTESEKNGELIYFDEGDGVFPDGQCFHCHGGVLFTDNKYQNNGMDAVDSVDDFVDKGRGEVTGNRFDNGKFRVPTLRNIEFTAPYMHDGRFETLDEVIEAYNEGGHGVENEDQNIKDPFGLTEENKTDLLAFIKTLADTTFLNNPEYKNPFE
jgi:cytochrome c peroxidase